MLVFPVLDLLRGQVVHGIAGRRRDYRPIRSILTPAVDPLAIAQVFRDHFGLTRLYLADLDAIAGEAPSLSLYTALQTLGFSLLIDAGMRTAVDAGPLLDAGIAGLVAGLETLASPEALAELVEVSGPEQLVFSLDLKDGQPLAAATWPAGDAGAIARAAIALGVRRILVLDLARVGTDDGPGTENICRQIKQSWPEVEVLAGGGVRGLHDLERLRRAGVDGVLVASALHDGRLRREDLTSYQSSSS
jgi:phosphoribosylformimino-5-aminoimidazole carboxamide ribotide isomerase